LRLGYRVRGTVRSVKNESKIRFLRDLDPSGDHLELVEADLNDPHSFDPHIRDCEFVLHTASPYTLDAQDPQRELVDPAVQGTRGVLQACVTNGNVLRRVVVTSSMAAITDSPEDNKIYNEQDWNTASTLKRNPYYFSKVLAERAAWEFMDQQKPQFDLVVINPFLVIGPALNNTDINTSNQVFKDILDGKFPGIMKIGWGFVDVRDVAAAHVLVIQKKEAAGRYVCANRTMWMKEVCELLRNRYPNYPIPKFDLACSFGNVAVLLGSYFEKGGTGSYIRTNLGKFPQFDHSKIMNLGLEFRDLNQTIFDTCDDLIGKGHIQKPKK